MKLCDIHSHFVYGMDDGAAAREDMFRMITAAHEDNIALLYATPHVTPGVNPFDTDRFARHFAEAEAYCKAQGYPMKLVMGAEILYTPAIIPYVQRRELPTMGNTNTVLVEFSPGIPLTELHRALATLTGAGYQVILAHVERYTCLHGPLVLERLRKNYPAIRLQVNAHSVTGELPLLSRLMLRHWLKAQLIDCIASDAHRIPQRPYLQTAAYETLSQSYPKDYVDRLITVG